MLSDLTTPNRWVNYLDYSMEYHKEYQINYPLVNLINLLMFLMFEVIRQSIGLDNCRIARLVRRCLVRSPVNEVITIKFKFTKFNQAIKFLDWIKNIKDLTLTVLMKLI